MLDIESTIVVSNRTRSTKSSPTLTRVTLIFCDFAFFILLFFKNGAVFDDESNVNVYFYCCLFNRYVGFSKMQKSAQGTPDPVGVK